MNDPINHPQHYTSHPSGVEPITITKHMNFCLGNVIKYVMRADYKGNRLDDLKKAQYYLNLEISELQADIDASFKELDDNYPTIESSTNEIIRKLQEAGVNVMPNGVFEATEKNIKIYNKISGEELAYKYRISAQYKPETWNKTRMTAFELQDMIVKDNAKCENEYKRYAKEITENYLKQKNNSSKTEHMSDTSDPSGEPFLTDLCKVIKSEESKNGI